MRRVNVRTVRTSIRTVRT
jgi:hypothetical protein